MGVSDKPPSPVTSPDGSYGTPPEARVLQPTDAACLSGGGPAYGTVDYVYTRHPMRRANRSWLDAAGSRNPLEASDKARSVCIGKIPKRLTLVSIER